MTDITATARDEFRRVRLEGAARVDRAGELKQRLLTAFESPSEQMTLEIDLTGVDETDLSLFQLLYAAGRMARDIGVDRVHLKATGGALQAIDAFGMRAGLEEAGVVVVASQPRDAVGSDSTGT